MENLHEKFLSLRSEIENYLRESVDGNKYLKVSRMYDLHGDTLEGCEMIVDNIRKAENKLWYALIKDEEDTDWGTGSFDKEEAVKKLIDSEGYYSSIAVIENDCCIEEIHVDDVM